MFEVGIQWNFIGTFTINENQKLAILCVIQHHTRSLFWIVQNIEDTWNRCARKCDKMSMCIGAQSVQFVTGDNFKRSDPASFILLIRFETGFIINGGQGWYVTIT